MRGNTFKRLISLALCAAMLVAAAVPVFAEEQTVTSSDGSAGGTSSGYNKTTLADLSDQLELDFVQSVSGESCRGERRDKRDCDQCRRLR